MWLILGILGGIGLLVWAFFAVRELLRQNGRL